MALAKLSPKAKAEAGVEITILHPETELPTGVYITVHGTDSEVCKTIQRRQQNRRLEKAAKKRGKAVATAESLEAEGLDLLVGCTISWREELKGEDGKVTGSRAEIEMEEGEFLPCTPENVRRVYEELPWIKEQIDQEIGDRSNFLQS